MFQRVNNEKVYMNIVNQVKNLISKGKLKPGNKLPSEQALAKILGVSRPPLREAIVALEVLGIVETKRGKGNFIKSTFDNSLYDQKFKELEKEVDPIELLEARKSIESEVAILAAEKATKDDVINIEKMLKEMEVINFKIPEIMRLDIKLHLAIAKATNNSVLYSVMIFLAEGKKEKLWMNLEEKSWAIPGRTQKYLSEHNEIFKAIKNKDSKHAKKAMYNHIRSIEKDWFE